MKYAASGPTPVADAWTVFTSLLARGYNDSLLNAVTNENAAERTSEAARARKASGDASKSPPERRRKTVKRAPENHPVDTTVDRENNDFLEQLKQLNSPASKSAAVSMLD